MLVQTLAGDSFNANCYLVASETSRRCLVIDPGVQAERILAAVREGGFSVAWIVLTHAHVDHCSGLAPLREATGAPFAAYQADDPAAPPPAPHLIIPGLSFTPFRLPFAPDRRLNDGEVLIMDDVELTVLHTPGHSADSICLHGHGVVFSGDTLMRGKIGAVLPGLFPGYDHGRLLDSIHRILLPLADETIVYPGHGRATTIGEERAHNPMLGREER